MIVQVQMLAASRPIITAFTTMSAWRKRAMGESAEVDAETAISCIINSIRPFSISRLFQALECLDPVAGLTLRTAVRADQGDRDIGFDQCFGPAHDSLMNDA